MAKFINVTPKNSKILNNFRKHYVSELKKTRNKDKRKKRY